MQIDYLEFDIDTQGRGVMYLVRYDGSYYDYLSCGVFNNKGLKLDLSCCELIGCMNNNGDDLDFDLEKVITARKMIEECWAIKPIKTMIKNAYQDELHEDDKVFLMPTGLSIEEKRRFIKSCAKR